MYCETENTRPLEKCHFLEEIGRQIIQTNTEFLNIIIKCIEKNNLNFEINHKFHVLINSKIIYFVI